MLGLQRLTFSKGAGTAEFYVTFFVQLAWQYRKHIFMGASEKNIC
jgi:hypothetical protein